MTSDGASPDGPHQDDDGLVVRAASGDGEAFRALHARITPSLCVWARLRLSARIARWVDPEDVVQEAWARVIIALPDFDTPGAFRAWVFGIAKRVALEACRHADRAASLPATEARDWQPVSQIADDVSTASRRIARDERVTELAGIIRGLQREDREILIGCGLEGRSATEVARRLGASAEAVTKRWQRQRQRYREHWVFAGDP